jgi:L-threonylcarbamoyladenylate synthase
MPIISTSVNRSGEKPLIHPEIIYQEFASEVSGIFYSRKRCFEKASTIIDLTGEEIRLIREGVIKFEDISAKFKQL